MQIYSSDVTDEQWVLGEVKHDFTRETAGYSG